MPGNVLANDDAVFKVPAPPPPLPRKVSYIYDNELAKCVDNISHIRNRSEMVHELIKVYGLLKIMDIQSSQPATKEDLLKFHSQDYVDFLFQAGDPKSFLEEDDDEKNESEDCGDEGNNSGGSSFLSSYGICQNGSFNAEDLDEFGLGYDCPVFKNLGKFALQIAGGTITAANCLVKDAAEVAINWCGGWHHAQRSEASGFCYVNDIVLGIHELQKKFKFVLYIDLDAHHGDGVENAFAFSDKVMTLSFHHFDSGYFPGSGKLIDVGKGRGKYFALNVPLKAGLVDQQFQFLFDSIIHGVIREFKPEALVVQCGADCLVKDPLGAFNLTLTSIKHCVRTILNLLDENGRSFPTLLLGGGGYNLANAARLWTSLTAEALNRNLKNDIPDNKFFLQYVPGFELELQPSLRKNENDDEYISELIETILTEFLPALGKRKELSN